MIQLASGVNKFSLLAIPFFVLAGAIMAEGGMSRRLVAFAGVLVGFIRGGLSLVNILASTFFGAISGSSMADTASIGSVLIPEMAKKGYPKEFATAVTVSGSVQAILIPPSHNAVLYSLAAGGSVYFAVVPDLLDHLREVAVHGLAVAALQADLSRLRVGLVDEQQERDDDADGHEDARRHTEREAGDRDVVPRRAAPDLGQIELRMLLVQQRVERHSRQTQTFGDQQGIGQTSCAAQSLARFSQQTMLALAERRLTRARHPGRQGPAARRTRRQIQRPIAGGAPPPATRVRHWPRRGPGRAGAQTRG